LELQKSNIKIIRIINFVIVGFKIDVRWRFWSESKVLCN